MFEHLIPELEHFQKDEDKIKPVNVSISFLEPSVISFSKVWRK